MLPSAFLLCGAVPLVPYLLPVAHPFPLSALLTGAAFFAIGAARGQWSLWRWWQTGLGTLFVGGVAAALAYLVGRLLKGVVLG